MPKRGWDADAEARRLECGCRRRGGGGAGVRSAAVGAPAACRCGVLRARTPRGRGRRYGRLSVGWLAERQGAGPVGLQGGVERGKTASVRWRSRALSLLCCRFAPPIPLRLRAACEDFLASRGFVSLGRVVSRAFHQVRGRAWIREGASAATVLRVLSLDASSLLRGGGCPARQLFASFVSSPCSKR